MATEQERLRDRGADGLYHPDPAVACGCFLDDLRPCGEQRTGCRAGRAVEINGVHGVFGPEIRKREGQ